MCEDEASCEVGFKDKNLDCYYLQIYLKGRRFARFVLRAGNVCCWLPISFFAGTWYYQPGVKIQRVLMNFTCLRQ